MRTSIIILILLLMSACYFNAEVEPDQNVWSYAQPDEKDMSNFLLSRLDVDIKSGLDNRYRNIRSLLVIKDDHIVFENRYFMDERRNLFSLDKGSSIISLIAFGQMLDDGMIDSLDMPVYLFLPTYAALFPEGNPKRQITFRHLLTHRAGWSWNDGILSRSNPANDFNLMRQRDDWMAFLLSKPLEAIPGTRYNYNVTTPLILASVIEHLTNKSFENYASEQIFEKLDIKEFLWERDPFGHVNAATGLSLNHIDYAKLAKFFMDQGKWQGDQIVSTEWTNATRQLQVAVSNFDRYGFYWRQFLNTNYTNKLEQNDVFFMDGESGNHLYIVPHKSLIVVVQSENLYSGFYNPAMFTYFEVVNSLN